MMSKKLLYKVRKFLLRFFLYLLATIIILPIILFFVLKSPTVQTYLGHVAAKYISKKLQTEVSIRAIDFSYDLDLVLLGIKVNDKRKNEALSLDRIRVDIKDYSLSDHYILLDKVFIDNLSFNLKKYKDENKTNIQFIFDFLASKDTIVDTTKAPKWTIVCEDVNISNSNFSVENQHKTFEPDFIDFDHLGLSQLNLHIENVVFNGDSLFGKIENLSVNERSGFIIHDFTTQFVLVPNKKIIANDLKANCNNTKLDLNVRFDMNSFKDFDDFETNVKLTANFKKTKVDMHDISYFARGLRGMKNVITISGEFKGKINNFKCKDFEFAFGKNTYFKGNIVSNGLPNIEETFADIRFKSFTTSQQDIINITLPSKKEKKSIKLPEILKNFGFINITGTYTGFYNDFVADLNINTNLGTIKTDLALKRNTNNIFEYHGDIGAENFALGKFINLPDLTKISFTTNVNGKNLDIENMTISSETKITQAFFKNYNYQNIDIDAKIEDKNISGTINIDDPNLNFSINAKIEDIVNKKHFKLFANIEKCKLHNLNIVEKDSIFNISTEIIADFKGFNLDEVAGEINLNKIYIVKNQNKINNFKINLNINKNVNKEKNIVLKSDFLDLTASGNFVLKNIVKDFKHILTNYLPSIIKYNNDSIEIANSTLKLQANIEIQKINQLFNLLNINASISENSKINLTIDNNVDSLYISLNTKKATLSSNVFNELSFVSYANNKEFISHTIIKEIKLTDSLKIKNINLFTKEYNDSSFISLNWKDSTSILKQGSFYNIIDFKEFPKLNLCLQNTFFNYNNNVWKVSDKNLIKIDSSSLFFQNLKFENYNESILIDGTISENISDELMLSLNNFNLKNIENIVNQIGINIKGSISGDLTLKNLYKSIQVIADIRIKKFTFNDDELGDLKVTSWWDNSNQALKLNADIIYFGEAGTSKPLSVDGFIFPNNKENPYTLTVNLSNFKLKLLNKYVSSVVSNLKGTTTGAITITGTKEGPIIEGKIKLFKTSFRFNYLNTSYNFTHDIVFKKNAISIQNLILNDTLPHKSEFDHVAICNCIITHNFFKDIRYNVNAKLNNLMCLNTTINQNSSYYGNALVSGLLEVIGKTNDIKINIVAKTEKGTKFFMPLSSTSEAQEYKFINFIDNKDGVILKDSISINKEVKKVSSGLVLDMKLEITPETEAQLIFDSRLGDIIKAKGRGNIEININTLGTFSMFGNYVIEEGDYLMTLQKIINKKFIIRKGSSVTWNGDAANAEVNISAVYKVRASLYELNRQEIIDPDTSRRNIPVECTILLTNKLLNPIIDFDIDFPTLSDRQRSQYKDVVQQEINKQVFSLLIMNSFYADQSQAGQYQESVNNNSIELLSNQVNNWLSSVNKNVNIELNYKQGGATTKDEVEVGLSTSLFGDRVTIDGMLGSNRNNTMENNSNNVIGDVNVDVKLTKDGKLRAKVFNKSNESNAIQKNSLYTQGIGLFYTKDFDRLSELFRKSKKPNEEKKINNDKK